MRISDWSSDVCSSDLTHRVAKKDDGAARRRRAGPVDEREKVGLDTREPAFAIVAERGCRERILAMPAMVDRRDVHPAADDRGERREIAACMLTHSVRDDQHRARRGAAGPAPRQRGMTPTRGQPDNPFPHPRLPHRNPAVTTTK